MAKPKAAGRPKGKNCAYRAAGQMCYRRAVQSGLCADHAAVMAQALKSMEEAVGEEPLPSIPEEVVESMVETETPAAPAVKSEYKAPKSSADLAQEAIEAKEAAYAAIDFDAEPVARTRRTAGMADPEVLAAALVASRIAGEQKQKKSMRGDVARDKDGFRSDPPRAPLKVQKASYFDDMPEDTDLTELPEDVTIKKGWVPRWVRPTDTFGKPSNTRVTEFKRFGYEVVKRADGSVCREDIGVLMQGPSDAYAKRVYKYTNKDALDSGKLMDHYHGIIEKHNREVGEEVFQLHVGKEHGSVRGTGVVEDDDQ
jgi:hypothetical protein